MRVNLRQRAEYENYSIPFVAGWCKGVWEEGIFVVETSDTAKGERPFFVPWGNVATVQTNAKDDAWQRQVEAQDAFSAAEPVKP